MKQKLILLTVLLAAFSTFSAEYYVDASRPNDTGAATSWATAKKTIQAAVNLTKNGDTVWVTNGTYVLSAEIAVTNAITIRGVNGPAVTIVDGNGATRCFNLGKNGCLIRGLTITGGFASGDWPDCRGGGVYCGGFTPVVSNCVIRANSAEEYGGGMYSGTAYNCVFTGNSADEGGGMDYGLAYNCVFSCNIASASGGGKCGGWAYNCTFTGNEVSGRWNDSSGGGMSGGNAYNCISWYNTAMGVRDDFRGTRASYSCSPDLIHGVDGNITNAPLLISSFHIATNSPCVGAGSAVDAHGTDLGGEGWQDPPSMGCDEVRIPIVGAIQLSVSGESNICVGVPCSYLFYILGNISRSSVDFGDGSSATNAVRITHTWDAPGIYEIRLTAFNDEYPGGVSTTKTVTVYSDDESAVYVSNLTGDDNWNGTSWAKAKKSIQAGVDKQKIFGGIVWVSNGTYSVSTAILVDKTVRVISVNGSTVTVVDGGGSSRCFNLGGSDCTIQGFTIRNGVADEASWMGRRGGGVYCLDSRPVISTCIITDNSAWEYGGGMYNGTARGCEFIDNWAGYGGGGKFGGTARSCAFSFNTAEDDGEI